MQTSPGQPQPPGLHLHRRRAKTPTFLFGLFTKNKKSDFFPSEAHLHLGHLLCFILSSDAEWFSYLFILLNLEMRLDFGSAAVTRAACVRARLAVCASACVCVRACVALPSQQPPLFSLTALFATFSFLASSPPPSSNPCSHTNRCLERPRGARRGEEEEGGGTNIIVPISPPVRQHSKTQHQSNSGSGSCHFCSICSSFTPTHSFFCFVFADKILPLPFLSVELIVGRGRGRCEEEVQQCCKRCDIKNLAANLQQ